MSAIVPGYMVGENLTPGRVRKVFLHEAVGHKGLAGLFGDDYNAFLTTVARQNNDEVMKIAAARGIDATTKAGLAHAADEYMATLAEKRTTNPGAW